MRSKKAIYNIITNAVLQLVILIYGFVVPKLIISRFGSSVNGLTASITQFLAYITLLESGFGPVVKSVLYKPIANKNKEEIERILKASEKFFRIISYIFLVYIVLLSCLYPLLVNNEFGYLFSLSLIIIISISTFAEYYFGMTYRLYLQAEQKTYITSIIQTISYILSILAVLVLVQFNVSIHIIKLFTGVIFIIRPLGQNLYVRKKYNINLKNVDGNYKIEQRWDGLAQHIAYVIHTNTDVTLLTIFCNLTEVSVYAVYTTVTKGIKSLIQIFTNGLESTFGDMIAKGESENLNKKFNIYEVIYYFICTILFSCTLILIVPFVQVYTLKITDANYVRYLFGYIIVIGEYIWAIRQPYERIVMAAGHFKQTKKWAYVEAISNIVISLILIKPLGMVGVAIGTAIAMTIRSIQFIYYTNKHILERKIIESIKKILLIIVETTLVFVISKFLPMYSNISYINWIINSIMVFCTAIIIIGLFNIIFYRKEFKSLINILKDVLFKKKREAN